MSMMRSKAVLGGVSAVIVAGFVAAVIAFSQPEPREDDEVLPTPSETPTEVIEALNGPDSCKKALKGSAVGQIDGPGDAKLVAGEADMQPVSGIGDDSGVQVDIGQREEDVIVQFDLSDVDLRGKQLGLPISQNGNILAPRGLWRVRLLTGDGDSYFERVFSSATVRSAAGSWCMDVSRIGDWENIGDASASDIVRLEYSIPGYAGAGAGNAVSFDDPVVSGE